MAGWKRWLLIGIIVSVVGAWPQPANASGGGLDTYPWPDDPAFPNCAPDDWGFCKRYCTSWVAFALQDRLGYRMEHTGDAKDWKPKAQARGYTVDMTPTPGAVAWWDATRTNGYGHVALVTAVQGERVVIEEYNYANDGRYYQRTIARTAANGYIHYTEPQVDNAVRSVVSHVQRGGTNTLYWAKADTVFESWWRPGGAVTHSALFQPPEGDIRDVAFEAAADGKHSLYVATSHAVYEAWWYPHQGIQTSATPILRSDLPIRSIIKTIAPDGVQQLYVMTDDGVDEYWWRPGEAIRSSRLYSLQQPIALQKASMPDGRQVLVIADQGYAYEVSWLPGADLAVREVMHIAQRDIVDLDLATDGVRQQVFVGTQEGGVWCGEWTVGEAVAAWQVAGGSGVRHVQAYREGGNQNVYVSTAAGVYEYRWPSGSREVQAATVVEGLSDTGKFYRSTTADGAQAVYTAIGPHITETYWWQPSTARSTALIE